MVGTLRGLFGLAAMLLTVLVIGSVAVAQSEVVVNEVVAAVEEGGPGGVLDADAIADDAVVGESPIGDPPGYTLSMFSTISGIIIGTLTGVATYRRLFERAAWLKDVPIWMVAVVISAVLVLIANTSGILDGSLPDLMFQAAVWAAGASGFRSWLKNVDVTPATMRLAGMVVVLGCVGMVGCAGDPAFVTAADQYHQTVGESWTEYVESDVGLTEPEKRVRLQAHEMFGGAVEVKRRELGF